MLSASTNENIDLAMTYSAYREIELVPVNQAEEVSRAILDLADDPQPAGALRCVDVKGCYYLPVHGWYVLYHLSSDLARLTVLGVLDGATHTVH